MATHDYVIDNSTGANVRADINNALAAIVSNNSNSSSPSTTYAYQWWADTSNNVLKIRNSANNAWIELLQLDGTLTLEDGSASTPALAFRDDLNTGIFSSAADTFNVATAGVERMELGATTIFNEDGADVDFRIEGDTNANLFYVDAGNDRIGIGTASPDTLLHLSGEDTAVIRLENTDTTLGNDQIIGGIEFEKQDATGAGVGIAGAIRLKSMSSVGQAASMFFSTSNSSGNDQIGMTIDFDGKVGIGTTSPSQELTIAGSDPVLSIQEASVSSQVDIGTGSATGFINIQKADGTRTIQLSGSTDSYFTGGNVGIGTTSPGYSLDVRNDSTTAYSASASPSNVIARIKNGSAQTNSHASFLLTATNDNGAVDFWWMTVVSQSTDYDGFLAFTCRTTSSASTELVRFSNNGNVTINSGSLIAPKVKLGSSNDHEGSKLVIQGSGNAASTKAVYVKNSDETPLFVLRNDGAFFTGTDGLSPYNLTTGNAANTFVNSDGTLRRSTSSVRYKKDITDATFGLADVLKLKPKTFKNNATGEFEDDKTYAGFTAEDIHDLGLTEFVVYNEANEPDALAYGNMVALMAKAIQELNAKVAALEAA